MPSATAHDFFSECMDQMGGTLIESKHESLICIFSCNISKRGQTNKENSRSAPHCFYIIIYIESCHGHTFIQLFGIAFISSLLIYYVLGTKISI